MMRRALLPAADHSFGPEFVEEGNEQLPVSPKRAIRLDHFIAPALAAGITVGKAARTDERFV